MRNTEELEQNINDFLLRLDRLRGLSAEDEENKKQNIAHHIKTEMTKQGINAQDIIEWGINKQQVYSVLRMGNTKRPDYKISTLLKVLNFVGIYELKING